MYLYLALLMYRDLKPAKMLLAELAELLLDHEPEAKA